MRYCVNSFMDKLALINSIVIRKRTNVIVSLDYEDADQIINACYLLAPYVLGIKIHTDIIHNLNDTHIQILLQYKSIYNLIIIVDRKFCDIGNTVKLQSKFITKYADLVTAHSISGSGVLDGLRENCLKNGCRVLLIAQMSSNNNLIDETYTQKTLSMAIENKDIVTGFITQKKLSNDFLHFAPGVNIKTNGDALQQRYKTPVELIYMNNVDILIVGRGITDELNHSEISTLVKQYNKLNYENLNIHNSCLLQSYLKDYGMLIKGKEFTLSSGSKSDTYYNLKDLISYPSLANYVSDLLFCLIQQFCQNAFLSSDQDINNIVLAGVPAAGVPLATYISSHCCIPLILVRDKQKTHGTCKQIEGNYYNKNIIIVEDVITTGKSVKDFINLIHKSTNSTTSITSITGTTSTNSITSTNSTNSTTSTINLPEQGKEKVNDSKVNDFKVNILGVISLVNRGNIRFLNTDYGNISIKSIVYA